MIEKIECFIINTFCYSDNSLMVSFLTKNGMMSAFSNISTINQVDIKRYYLYDCVFDLTHKTASLLQIEEKDNYFKQSSEKCLLFDLILELSKKIKPNLDGTNFDWLKYQISKKEEYKLNYSIVLKYLLTQLYYEGLIEIKDILNQDVPLINEDDVKIKELENLIEKALSFAKISLKNLIAFDVLKTIIYK